MGKQSFGRKQGFQRLKPQKESGKTRKNRRIKDEIEHRPSPSDSGDFSEEHSNAASEEKEAAVAEEEEVAYREPAMYDHLLKTLSGSESFAKAYKKRQREEEGKSDTEEDLGSELESFSASEEEDDSNEGTDKESPGSLDLKSNPQGSGLVGEHSDNVGDEDEGCSEIDEARDLEVNGHSALEVSVRPRTTVRIYTRPQSRGYPSVSFPPISDTKASSARNYQYTGISFSSSRSVVFRT